MYLYVVALVSVAFISGYVLGRKHQKQIAPSADHRPVIIRTRPYTEKEASKLPEPTAVLEDHSTVVDSGWGRPELPNSGVRWR